MPKLTLLCFFDALNSTSSPMLFDWKNLSQRRTFSSATEPSAALFRLHEKVSRSSRGWLTRLSHFQTIAFYEQGLDFRDVELCSQRCLNAVAPLEDFELARLEAALEFETCSLLKGEIELWESASTIAITTHDPSTEFHRFSLADAEWYRSRKCFVNQRRDRLDTCLSSRPRCPKGFQWNSSVGFAAMSWNLSNNLMISICKLRAIQDHVYLLIDGWGLYKLSFSSLEHISNAFFSCHLTGWRSKAAATMFIAIPPIMSTQPWAP